MKQSYSFTQKLVQKHLSQASKDINSGREQSKKVFEKEKKEVDYFSVKIANRERNLDAKFQGTWVSEGLDKF